MVLALATSFTACQDDEIINEQSPILNKETKDEPVDQVAHEDAAGSPVTVLMFTEFLHDDDVIVNANQTELLVNKAYLAALNKNTEAGRPVVVWRSQNEPSFPCRIARVEEMDTRVKIYIEPADISDVLANRVNLNTSIYTNPNEPARTNGNINATHYVENTEDGEVLHPVAFVSKGDANCSNGEVYIPTTLDKMGSVMIEDLEASNFDLNLRIIDVDFSVKDLNFIEDHSSDSLINTGFGFKTLGLRAQAGFKMVIDPKFEASWWPPFIKSIGLNEFSFVSYADVNANFDLHVWGKAAVGNAKPKETSIGKMSSFWATFMCGLIPVTIDVAPDMVVSNQAQLAINGELGIKGALTYRSENGSRYKDGKWSTVDTCDSLKFTKELYGNADVEFFDELGLFFKLKAKVYSIAGPSIKGGPSVRLDARAGFRNGTNEYGGFPYIYGQIKASYSIKATVMADITIASWNLCKWQQIWSLLDGNFGTFNWIHLIDKDQDLYGDDANAWMKENHIKAFN